MTIVRRPAAIRNTGSTNPHIAEHEGGNVAVVFALVASVLLVVVGGSIDAMQSFRARAAMQQGVDAASLAAVRYLGSDETARKSLSNTIYLANVAGLTGAGAGTLSNSGDLYTYTATYDAPMNFMKMIGLSSVPLTVSSTAVVSSENVDVALVLDNTDSMDSTRMTQLKKASKLFLASFETGSTVQVALIPFAEQVRIDPSSVTSAVSSLFDKSDAPATWSGCLNDRTQPYDVTNDAASATMPTTLYPEAKCEDSDLHYMVGLTNDLSGLSTTIDSLKKSGLTNIPIGIQWGMEALTSALPLSGVRSDARKYMIIMTDGENTHASWTAIDSKIDARMKLACTNAKTAGITVYTINLIAGDETLLKTCAGDTSKYFLVKDASKLSDTFAAIAKSIRRARITK